MSLTIAQAAEIHGTTRQALFVAIRNNKLKATKADGFHWSVTIEDLKAYSEGRYSRKNLKHNGELVYPPDQGLISVAEASKILNILPHKIYYAIYKNRIKYTRNGCAYVIHVDDVKDYERNHLIHFTHA